MPEEANVELELEKGEGEDDEVELEIEEAYVEFEPGKDEEDE